MRELRGFLTPADRSSSYVRDRGGYVIYIRKALEKGYSMTQIWGQNIPGCKSSGPNTENGSGFWADFLGFSPVFHSRSLA